MGKTTTYTVDPAKLAELMRAMPYDTSVVSAFQVAAREATAAPAPQNTVTFE